MYMYLITALTIHEINQAKGEIDNSTVIVGDFNIPPPIVTDRITRQINS